jgi:SAM-dependent methyltransferase
VPASGDDPMHCDACGRVFERQQGIYRFLPAARPHLWERFVEQYRLVREREGYRPDAPDYYRHLPSVPQGDPAAALWRIRRESYAHLQRHALPAVWRGPIRILDLGAGCGWLSHRLASFGHHVVAVDRLDDERDGLGVCRHYPVALTAVQADFDALPFDAGQFDLIVFDAALHYATDPARTLDRSACALSPGGVLAVVDSPMFADDETGRSMVADEDRRLRAEHGVEDVVRPGLGYLTFEALDKAAAALGLRSQFVPSSGPLGWRARRQVARWRIGREPAAFGVWVAG